MNLATKIYFVNRGQSNAELSGCYSNDTEASLTFLGRAQAAKIGQTISNLSINIEVLICSSYASALESCLITLEYPGVVRPMIIIDPRVNERELGDLVGREITEECNFKINKYNSDYSVEHGVETLEQLEQRAKEFLDDIKQKYQNRNILVFSHVSFGLALRSVAKDRQDDENLYTLPFSENGKMMVLEV